MKKYSITYQKTRIMVPYPRPIRLGVCSSCKRDKAKHEIKVTQMHHTIYEFLTKTVKKNPLLALKNAIEFCFPCHGIADGFRAILDKTSLDRMMMVVKLLPRMQLVKLARFCKLFLKWWDVVGRHTV